MDRRQFLVGLGGTTAVLAGCTGGADDPEESTESEGKYSELPEAEELLDQHYNALRDMVFASEEKFVNRDSTMTDRTIRRGDTGTLVKGNDVARNINSDGKQRVWFSGNARVSRATHRFNPNGITPPFTDRTVVTSLIELTTLERVDVSGDDERVFVFEGTEIDEETEQEGELSIRSIDVRIAVAESGYIRSMDAELTTAKSSDADQTASSSYEYEVSEVGDVTVSAPAFVDDAVRIEGDLSEDRSAIVLQHAGGPTVAADTKLVVEDNEGSTNPNHPNGLAFPTAFESGDEAYVYWTAANQAAISVGEEPSDVAREFSFPSEDGDRGIYLAEIGAGPDRFSVAIDPQE
jgi:hypothetical protein